MATSKKEKDKKVQIVFPEPKMSTATGKILRTVQVKFAKGSEDAIIPSKRPTDMGLDVYPCFKEEAMIIDPSQTSMVPTGIYAAVEEGWGLVAKERGSTGTNGMRVGAGVIEGEFRGEIFIAINNTNSKPIAITKGTDKVVDLGDCILYPYSKAIAQLLVVEVPELEIEEITLDELKAIPSVRGAGKLGSSGK